MKNSLKGLYKSIVPRVVDKLNVYDNTINNYRHKYFVPMYHRVITNPDDDPYKLGMCVTEETFSQQLEYFSNNFTSISLSEYSSKRHEIESNDRPYVTLTFDDGYSDNFDVALPIIKKYKLHSTIFVCTSIFDDQSNYWWDSIINAFKASTNTQLDLSGLNIEGVSDVLNLKGSNNKIVRGLLYSLWKNHLYKDKAFINEIVSRLLGGQQEPLIGHLSEQKIIDLHNMGVDIAAHTLSHPDLTGLSLKEAKYQIEKSKSIITDLLGADVKGFAYPSGFKNKEIVELVQQAGFEYAACTDVGVNYTFNPYEIERIGMPQSNLSDLKRCLSMHSKCK